MKSFKELTGTVISNKRVLNPKLFGSDKKLHPEVRKGILQRANAFVSKLGLSPDAISDVRIVGGNASYNYNDSSDIDATIMIDRSLELSREEIRRLGISASNLTYRLNPSVDGIDLNFYVSSRNIGSLRPTKQSIYSLGKNDFLFQPTKVPEVAPNYLAAKASYFCQMIEECISDDSEEKKDCAKNLYNRIKRYRVKGLSSKDGEYSTENLVYRLLSRSNYIRLLKDKVERLERDYFRLKKSELMESNELKMLALGGDPLDLVPLAILHWNKRILLGEDPREMIERVKPILHLLRETSQLGE